MLPFSLAVLLVLEGFLLVVFDLLVAGVVV